MDKPFALGILVGRFQTLHAGHQQMIETALSLCDQVGIFVGSSQAVSYTHLTLPTIPDV